MIVDMSPGHRISPSKGGATWQVTITKSAIPKEKTLAAVCLSLLGASPLVPTDTPPPFSSRLSRCSHLDCRAAKSARRRVAQDVQAGERGVHLREKGSELLGEAPARFGRGNAARRAVEQAHAQAILQAAHGLAKSGRADAQRAPCLSKAACPRDSDESGEIVDVSSQCPIIRTAYVDYAGLSSRSARATSKVISHPPHRLSSERTVI